MTVKELIKVLSNLSPDLNVIAYMRDEEIAGSVDNVLVAEPGYAPKGIMFPVRETERFVLLGCQD